VGLSGEASEAKGRQWARRPRSRPSRTGATGGDDHPRRSRDVAADSQDRYYEIARYLDRVCEVVEKKMADKRGN
jgi:hypothetical protein